MAHVPLGPIAAAQIEGECLRLYRKVIDRTNLQATDDFIGAGGNSVQAVLIATELEALFGIEVTMDTFYERNSASELASWLAETLSQQHER